MDLALMAQVAKEARISGWLLYDFRGQNPFAANLVAGAHLTRRWFLYVPSVGEPVLIRHRIEVGNWQNFLPNVRRLAYSSYSELSELLSQVLAGARKVAMEYSLDVPYVSKVDGGTIDFVRSLGVEVVSSANLLQHFLTWSEDDLSKHQRAALALSKAKNLAFQLIDERLRQSEAITELEVQDLITNFLQSEGLIFNHPADVSFGRHTSDPHYDPRSSSDTELRYGQAVLLDLWAAMPGHPYADIAWVGFAGQPTAEYAEVWQVVAKARDAALAAMQLGRCGWEIDRIARDLIEIAGYGKYFTHRLGHSLGLEVHGSSVNLDDLEAHDTRLLQPGLAVTIEPGIYLGDFGIRSEINVFLAQNGPVLTTEKQESPIVLGAK